MSTFNLPDLGEGLQEAEIVEWHVKEGDEVEVDQPLLAVETAKAIVDVPSPEKGVVTKIHVQVGDIPKVGEGSKYAAEMWLEDIKAAQEHIHLNYYISTEDEFTLEIKSALI